MANPGQQVREDCAPNNSNNDSDAAASVAASSAEEECQGGNAIGVSQTSRSAPGGSLALKDAAGNSEEGEDEEGDGDEEEVSSDLLQQLQSLMLAAPQEARQPLLLSFDLEGVASYISSGICHHPPAYCALHSIAELCELKLNEAAGRARNIVVMCGAGVSVSAGIPDFRSPGSGLYSKLADYGLPRPEAVFDIGFFRSNPAPFYRLAKELLPGNYKPTPAHFFLRLLHERGLLRRCLTQNIDSLERLAGLPPEAIVAAHGNFDRASCVDCQREVPVHHVAASIMEGTPHTCTACGGYVKPGIVFFGEALPSSFRRAVEEDMPAADLLIVMGTSLQVQPFASLVGRVRQDVPRLLINREKVGETDPIMLLFSGSRGLDFGEGNYRDALFLGDCDEGCRRLAELLGWRARLDQLVAEGAAAPGMADMLLQPTGSQAAPPAPDAAATADAAAAAAVADNGAATADDSKQRGGVGEGRLRSFLSCAEA